MLLLSETYQYLFNLDAQLLFSTALLAAAIFVLFLVASNLLFNPAKKLLKDRQDRIAKDISDAKDDKESAAALKAEYESKLKNIEKEAEIILSEARQPFSFQFPKGCPKFHYALPVHRTRYRRYPVHYL